MTCAKHQVKARLTCKSGAIFYGENVCTKPQATCPRQPGEGYLKCLAVCGQPVHAEVSAIFQAIDAGQEIRGGSMLIVHDKVCDHCKGILAIYDISWELCASLP